MEIELKYPIIIDGIKLEKLTMRRSKVRDRLAVSNMKENSDEQKEIRLFANLCEVSAKTIEELDEIDYLQVQKAYMGFFGLGEKDLGGK